MFVVEKEILDYVEKKVNTLKNKKSLVSKIQLKEVEEIYQYLVKKENEKELELLNKFKENEQNAI